MDKIFIRKLSGILLLLSAIGVTFSGSMILGWIEVSKFFDLGPTATLVGGYLDIIGGTLQFVMLGIMVSKGVFSEGADKIQSQRLFKIMAGICLIGLIADPLGGLLAIAAQIGLYTSILMYKYG